VGNLPSGLPTTIGQPSLSQGLSSGKDPPSEDLADVARHIALSRRESTEISADQIPRLRDQWKEKYADLFGSIPLELPPFREVNHEINLVDPNKCIHYCLPKCPEHYQAELSEHIL
jgi:hypothetical protein